MSLRYLIIGGGLAGTCLAWRLHQQGVPFLLIDREEEHTSSKVAAGLLTPITGMRLNLSWRFPQLYQECRSFYGAIENQLNQTFFHEVPIVRLLRDEKAAQLWSKRSQQAEIIPFLKEQSRSPLVDERYFDSPYGGFEMTNSGWLDAAHFLSASRDFFIAQNAWRAGSIAASDLRQEPNQIFWQDKPFSQVVFCIGWEAEQHPWFDWVPFRSARGTVLKVKADLGDERRIINRGCWLLPHHDGSLRAGPTYELDFRGSPSTPSPSSLSGLEAKLRLLLKVPYQIEGTQTGVRPIISHRQALLGRHPAYPQIAFFNGLGSKGVLRAPWMALHLANHLLESHPLEQELDLAHI